MHWAHPEWWIWLWLIPAIVGFWVWAFSHRKRSLERFASQAVLRNLSGRVDWGVRRLKAAFVTGGLLCLLLALIGPQWGFRWQEVKRQGVDIIVALDVSKSMLAEDVKPNRLGRAKLAIRGLLPLLKGDRIGLIAFAGSAFLQCPLTNDYGAFALTLDRVDTNSIPRGGTALAQAIHGGIKAFEATPKESRALILISDGESHEGNTLAAAKQAAQDGVKIYTIGIGTTEGELVPIIGDNGKRTFLKDQQGRTVKSRLDEDTLRELAVITGGSFVRATATEFGLDVIYNKRISTLEKQEFESTMKKQRELRYQWVLALALLLLGVEPFVSDRRRVEAGG